jgi:hypothetical protein
MKLGIVKKAAVKTPAPAKKKVAAKAKTTDMVTASLENAAPAPDEASAPAAKADKTAKAEKAPKAPKTPKEKAPSKFVSRDAHAFTLPNGDKFNDRLRVSEFQDLTFYQNGTKKLTDAQLVELWQEQFPTACGGAFNVFHVKGARRDYNAGKHSKMFDGVKTGDRVSVEYDATKAVVPVRGKAAPTTATA